VRKRFDIAYFSLVKTTILSLLLRNSRARSKVDSRLTILMAVDIDDMAHDPKNNAANLFAKFTIRQIFKSLVIWIKCVVKCLAKRKRFVILSPPFMRSQFFLDTKNSKLFSIEIRDWDDWGIMLQIFYVDHYDLRRLIRYEEIETFYLQCLNDCKCPLILDCGGNIGLASRYFSETFPKSKIVCVEPDKNNLIQAKLNNPINVDFLEVAVGSSDSKGSIIDPGLGNSAYRISSDGIGAIEIISVTSLLHKFSGANIIPFIIKIDIEGFESELFSKNTEWLEKFPILIIELHDWLLPKASTSNNFLRVISNSNRDFVSIGENIFCISNEKF
jgi:FkbM family methyltransferase